LYLYALLVSVWRTYKFDVFRVAHKYKNGANLFDNVDNVKDAAFDYIKNK